MEEIRYLRYILQKNGSDEKHIQDRKKRATVAENMKHGRKNFLTGLQEEDEDVWSTDREHGAVWSRSMGLEYRRQAG